MPELYGYIECATHKKFIASWSREELPCGVYYYYQEYIGNISRPSRLDCKECRGTGGGEEVSGGHKKECEECFGTGLHSFKSQEFESYRPKESRQFLFYLGGAHSGCETCFNRAFDWETENFRWETGNFYRRNSHPRGPRPYS